MLVLKKTFRWWKWMRNSQRLWKKLTKRMINDEKSKLNSEFDQIEQTRSMKSNSFWKKIEFIMLQKKKTSRLCISWFLKKRVYVLIHDDNHHCDFHRAYVRIFESFYIKHLIKRFRKYIKFCRQCIEDQITRHAFYEEFHFIKTLALFFHTIIIDFIFVLSKISTGLDFVFIITNKFFKKINLISKKSIWSASKWASPWLVSS